MGREPTPDEIARTQDVSERELTARPTLTDADRARAEDQVGVTEADHRAAGKADAIDQGTSGGEAEVAGLRAEREEAERRSS